LSGLSARCSFATTAKKPSKVTQLILQTDVLERNWEPIKIKSPRRVKKLPVVLSLEEVEALIILSKKALELLRLYYKATKPTVYLFETNLKKGMYLSNTSLDNIVKRNAAKAGIKKKISFHTLRHTFATHLLKKGVNIKLIRQFLGHTSIKTTMIYLHVANIEPGSIVSPLDDLDI